jgi:AcrR family transcriptional regulator
VTRETTRATPSPRMRRTDTGPGLDPNLTSDWRHYDELHLNPILDAAVEEFRLHGYHGATVREIAARVGVTVPTLYYHYQNKQGMLVTILIGAFHDVITRCEYALEQAGDRPEARLSNLVECISLYMMHRRRIAFLDAEVRSLEPPNRARYGEQREKLSMMLRRAVSDGVDDGVFETGYPVEAVRAIVNMCQAISDWYTPGGTLSESELAGRYVELALGAVRFRATGSVAAG